MATKKATTIVENDEEKPFLSEDKIRILRETLLKEYNEADIIMFLTVAEITKLDPFTRQLMPRPEKKAKGPDGKWTKMILITAYTGFLTVADRSGVYDGSDPFEWCGKNGEWTQVWTAEEPPFAARVATWRKDHTRPEVAVVYWKARAQYYFNNNSRVLTDQWRDDGAFMLGKCALAASLRKLFPNLLTQVYEESEFKTLDQATSTLEQDIEKQKERIAESSAAQERLVAEGLKPVQPSGPVFPREAQAEVEPAKGLEPKGLEPKEGYQPGDDDFMETNELSANEPNAPQRPADWWMNISCDLLANKYYKGKLVCDLSYNLLSQAVEKWVPLVRAKWEQTTQPVRDLAEALEIGLMQADKLQAELEAKQAAQGANGQS